ncbi:MAG: DNA-directed RNA polymerase subunit A' [Nanoarchaeota archaeon]|nr:DNA-directed RNA polymerase subunit A' [Nanoarchaeota archaeon]
MDFEHVSKKVGAVTFSLVSPEQVKKLGVAKIVTPELYDMGGYPVDGGLMDLRLGAIDPGIRCRTCGGKLKECLGHFGFIEMARPTVHVKYVPMIELLLRSTCQECGKILLSDENIKKHKNNLLKKAKDVKKCPYCKAEQEKVKVEKPTTFMSGKKRIFPSEVRARLVRIPDEDCRLLGIDPVAARPEWGILTLLLVPPVTARPSITLETGERSEDDLTHKLGDIIRSNQRLWENLNAGAPEVIIEDLWDLLQYHVTTFFDNGISQVPPARHRSGQPLETVTERIEGKEGRIRHNLIGKRVNFSSRCVISPDPSLHLNDVGIPYEIARVLTVPERVTSQNINRLKALVQKGDDWPGAVYIIRPDGKKKRITEELKAEILDELVVGYIVERHLTDGDVVLFNRHPSLHRASLMSHYARILPGKTFRLHPGTASPYNADFDGDEMNVHVPQTEEAISEAKTLLNVEKNLISPKNNTNLLGCITDAITGSYLLSINKVSKKQAVQLLVGIGGDLDRIAEIKGDEIDGKDVFSVILPNVTLETKTKSCKGKDCKFYDNCKKEDCPTNDYLSIKKGRFLSGVMDNSNIGVEGGVLIKEIDRQVGRRAAMETLERLFALGTAFLSQYGFTISLNDVNMPTLQNSTSNILKDAWKKTDEIIGSYEDGSLEVIPGKTKEESREMKILHTLNEVRSKLGELVKKEIPNSNPANVMIKAGSAGNILYITQMACSVGQQALWAKRIEIGYSGRTLSFFKKHELSPLSRGFIKSGFFKGLEPYEFFFGAIAGRDALMDTALRTPKSGYLYRRITNALQDLKVEYDFTVRDATGRIIQFMYGEDGADVSRLHLDNVKIDPGEAIGIVTAQSFGEPSTQMALSVFHFAGISEMQVTLGLPRLVEIFDARKLPSTPQMEIFLDSEYNNDEKAAALAKKIKEIKLRDISSEINVEFTEGKIEVKLDKSALQNSRITAATVVKRLEEKNYSASLKEDSIIVNAKKVISRDKEGFKELYKIKEKLKDVIIAGIKGISQILVKKEGSKYIIITAGSNLEEILNVKGVDADRTTTNNIHEVSEVLGIETARQVIIKEIRKVITEQGLDIDERHILLVADTMTASGEVKGMTRIGIISEKNSIFARASFETPIKHFVNASIHGSVDPLNSIIENVIINQPVPVGTGLPGLFVKITGKLAKEDKKKKAKKE